MVLLPLFLLRSIRFEIGNRWLIRHNFRQDALLAEPLADLLYRLASSCEHRDKLSGGGVPAYPHQLPALLHIPVQEQVEAVPPGEMPGFALVGTAGEK